MSGKSDSRRVLFVGESNPYGIDQRFALYHLPRHASGNRLREHLGLTDVQYARIDKVNLCKGDWSLLAARVEAKRLLGLGQYEVFVLLGRKVRAAFEGPAPFSAWYRLNEIGWDLIGLPHPSGLNRQWNEPGARERARSLVFGLLPHLRD